MPRVLIVANRLPITVKVSETGVEVERSSGGLATGLQGPHEQSDGLWIGWSGTTEELSPERQTELNDKLEAMRLVAVPLSVDQVTRYYEGFSNGVLWPLFHYLLEQIPLQVSDWDAYVEANERFADVVAAHYRPGDLIWVHDYQLLLLPGLLRKRIPDARIGFFLHIPFPSEELFRTLPARERILEGLLGADLVGFHTPAYLRHFATSLIDILGISVDIDRVQLPDREVRLGVFPMGIDAATFAALSVDPAVVAEAKAIRGDGSVRVLVGVDRLDYTKGIPRRLLAYERMLLTHPELRERVRLLQVAVPSRTGVGAYQDFRTLVDQLVGKINGSFGTPRWVPVHYIFRALSEPDLVALYRAADVMLVTPLRDGMNLVAKEFLASRSDGDGVLVLSEFAGAAWELPEAVRVNPYDVEGAAEVYYRALTMPVEERRARLAPLRSRVQSFDVHRWVASFLEQLEESTPIVPPRGPPAGAAAAREALTRRLAETDALLLLLDYDGTLVPFAATPDLARPDPGLVSLLGAAAARPDTEVHVVSGRAREALDHWLGHLPVWLHAEHAFWSRAPDSKEWVPAAEPGEAGASRCSPSSVTSRRARRARSSRPRPRPSPGTIAWPIPKPARAAPTSFVCISTRCSAISRWKFFPATGCSRSVPTAFTRDGSSRSFRRSGSPAPPSSRSATTVRTKISSPRCRPRRSRSAWVRGRLAHGSGWKASARSGRSSRRSSTPVLAPVTAEDHVLGPGLRPRDAGGVW